MTVVPFRRPASKQLETDNPPLILRCYKCQWDEFHIIADGRAVCGQCGESHYLPDMLRFDR